MKKKKDTYEKWVEEGSLESKLAVINVLAAQGLNMKDIAQAVGIQDRTLYKMQQRHSNVRDAIERGRVYVVAECHSYLMDQVRDGNITAIIYALKVYGGDFYNDRKKQEVEVKGDVQQVHFYLPEKDKPEN